MLKIKHYSRLTMFGLIISATLSNSCNDSDSQETKLLEEQVALQKKQLALIEAEKDEKIKAEEAKNKRLAQAQVDRLKRLAEKFKEDEKKLAEFKNEYPHLKVGNTVYIGGLYKGFRGITWTETNKGYDLRVMKISDDLKKVKVRVIKKWGEYEIDYKQRYRGDVLWIHRANLQKKWGNYEF